MENYDKEFLDFMKAKYRITLDDATDGQESQIITFAVAWNVWKHAKRIYSQNSEISISRFMSDDHSRLDYIFEEFRRSKKAGLASQLFLAFKMGMERHIRWEEEILFPLARRKLGKDTAMLDELILQHKRIRGSIRDISGRLDSRDAGLENDLEQLLAGHDKMEEEGMYPWIDDSIDEREKGEVLSRMKA
ncbi:MAG: hemerythrin domain-containing protein [Candidatus Micrarchaeota archaeon]|nr:hemerythrin domain-containing protein [Candidatus Micrarchaeota archaeon]